MVLDSVTDRLGGKQAKRVIDLVDDLWDSRKRIVSMVDFVWDHRSQLADVIDFMGDNQERIADLIGRLPELVSHAGVGLEAAGSGAQRASLLLSDEEDGPKQFSEAAASALERCQEQLAGIASLLAELGDGLDGVRIPTVQANRTEVMGFSVVSGIDIGERPLLDVATKRVGDGAADLAGVAAELGDVASKFRSLGSQLADVGVDLGDAATGLSGSGSTLRSFVGDAPQTTAKRKPTSPQRRSSAPRKRAASSKPKPAPKQGRDGKKSGAIAPGVAKKAAAKRTAKQRAARKSASKKQASRKTTAAKKSPAKAPRTAGAKPSIVPASRTTP